MDFKKMLLACCDINQDNIPKTSFYLSIVKKDVHTGEEFVLDEVSFKSVCNIYKSLKEFQLDLVFPDNTDAMLNLLVDKVNNFRNPLNSIEDEAQYVSFINIVIVPDEFNGQFYIVCLDAFDVNLTSYSTMELPNILRFNFLPTDTILVEDESKKDVEEVPEDELDAVIEEVFLSPDNQEIYKETSYDVVEEPDEDLDDEDDDFY